MNGNIMGIIVEALDLSCLFGEKKQLDGNRTYSGLKHHSDGDNISE